MYYFHIRYQFCQFIRRPSDREFILSNSVLYNTLWFTSMNFLFLSSLWNFVWFNVKWRKDRQKYPCEYVYLAANFQMNYYYIMIIHYLQSIWIGHVVVVSCSDKIICVRRFISNRNSFNGECFKRICFLGFKV